MIALNIIAVCSAHAEKETPAAVADSVKNSSASIAHWLSSPRSRTTSAMMDCVASFKSVASATLSPIISNASLLSWLISSLELMRTCLSQ